MHIASIGIDLGKTTFHLVALGERNKILLRKKFSRSQLLAYTAKLPLSLIGLEACAGAHFLGGKLREQGHQVRLIPAQFVKPYRKSNKNDFLDAEAIAEAVTKQNMRFVQLKTQEQLDWQAMHRVRDRLVQRRTALINEIRGFLLERGITFAAQPIHLRKNLPGVIEDAEQNLSPRLRWLLDRMWQEWKQIETDVQAITDAIERISNDDARCRQLRQIPGFGPLISTATVAAIGNGAAFHRGRDFAAWVGVVPRQYSTGGYRQALKVAKDNETAVTNVFTGRPARAIVNRLMRETGPMSDVAPEFPLAAAAVAPLRAKSEMAGSGDFSPLWSGQAVRLNRELPAAELTKQLAEETLEKLRFLQIMASPDVLAQAAALATVSSRQVPR